MGNDTPLAVLSDKPQLLYNYFKQLFAQVTNPPIDAIREEIVMAVDTTIGPRAEPARADARALPARSSCRHPILTNEELEKLRARHVERSGAWLPVAHARRSLFPAGEGGRGLERALEELCRARRRGHRARASTS